MYMAIDRDGAMVGWGKTKSEAAEAAGQGCTVVRARVCAVRHAVRTNGLPEMWELLRMQNGVVTFAGAEVES